MSRADPTSALRSRRHRRRQREKAITLPPVELRSAEIATLIADGLLEPAQRQDRVAVLHALYSKLDEVFTPADNTDSQ